MVNGSKSGRILFIFPLQIQFCQRLAPQNLSHAPCFCDLLMRRKKHFDRFRKSGTISSPPSGAQACTFTSITEFLVRLNYARNMRETLALFFFRKKKRAPFEGSLGTCTEYSSYLVKEKNRNADTTDPCLAAKHASTFFDFSCMHRVVLGCITECYLVSCYHGYGQAETTDQSRVEKHGKTFFGFLLKHFEVQRLAPRALLLHSEGF